ncbi:MAG: HAD family hydrolase [Methanosphaera sp.]|nr:HAD family hydrolase [Methanosphaera sp.]
MKAIVFDNAGTILQRKTIIKDMSTKKVFFNTDTIGIANKNDKNIIVVFQTPVDELYEYSDMSIKQYMLRHNSSFEIAYSQINVSNEQLLDVIRDDAMINDILETYELLLKRDVRIISGAAVIVDTTSGMITHVYTAGGSFFKYTSDVMDYLKEEGFEIYIASGDNKHSLNQISSILNIAKNNIYSTCNVNCKESVIEKLQNEGYYVYMVGNHTNDILAIKKADTGILTLQQKELLPKRLISQADYVISSIDMVIDVIKKES